MNFILPCRLRATPYPGAGCIVRDPTYPPSGAGRPPLAFRVPSTEARVAVIESCDLRLSRLLRDRFPDDISQTPVSARHSLGGESLASSATGVLERAWMLTVPQPPDWSLQPPRRLILRRARERFEGKLKVILRRS